MSPYPKETLQLYLGTSDRTLEANLVKIYEEYHYLVFLCLLHAKRCRNQISKMQKIVTLFLGKNHTSDYRSTLEEDPNPTRGFGKGGCVVNRVWGVRSGIRVPNVDKSLSIDWICNIMQLLRIQGPCTWREAFLNSRKMEIVCGLFCGRNKMWRRAHLVKFGGFWNMSRYKIYFPKLF